MLEHEVVVALPGEQVEDLLDVGMADACGHPRLTAEALDPLRISQGLAPQRLHQDTPTEPRLAGQQQIARAIDLLVEHQASDRHTLRR